MKAFSLYDKTSAFGGIYVIFIVNRMQVLYFVLIMPMYLVHPYMIWGILAIGILSQLNLMIFSKWFSSDFSAKGYQGFVQLFGERMVRFFAFLGWFLIFIKITVVTLGYVEIVHRFIFPSIDIIWLILFILLISCYVAAHGMEKSIRFVVITILCSMWLLIVYVPFFSPPLASLHDLYPLIPAEWSMHSWKALLFIWSSLSGPEYLLCMIPWLSPKQKMLKYLTMANALSIFEYLVLFVAALLFYGSNYLSEIRFPVVHMIRYLQTPVFDRIDILLISVHMFNFVFAISIFLLFLYGASRIIAGRVRAETTRIGFMTSFITIYAGMIVVNKWFWNAASGRNIWLDIQVWVGAFTYFLVPAFLWIAIKLKGRA